jgi:hypothetical protein
MEALKGRNAWRQRSHTDATLAFVRSTMVCCVRTVPAGRRRGMEVTATRTLEKARRGAAVKRPGGADISSSAYVATQSMVDQLRAGRGYVAKGNREQYSKPSFNSRRAPLPRAP